MEKVSRIEREAPIKGGKEEILLWVAQVIPNFYISCYKLPINFCNDVEWIIINFWWGNSSFDKVMNWKTWSTLCRPKEERGMGFNDLEKFITALLAKQFWSFYCFPNLILAKVAKASYFPHSSIWEAKFSFQPKLCIKKQLEFEITGWEWSFLDWRIGDGKTTPLWRKAWLGGEGTP